MFGLFGKSLSHVLHPTKIVKIHGIKFTIRKLNALDYASGAQVLRRVYDNYSRGEKAEQELTSGMIEKVKTHYRDTFCCAIISVKCNGIELELTRKDASAGEKLLNVDNLLTDWGLAEELYAAILEFSFGKKKLPFNILPKRRLANLT